MASYRGVQGVVLALADFLNRRLPTEWQSNGSARVALLGSADLADALNGNLLGIYLHRISMDPNGRNRLTPRPGVSDNAPDAELPVNLHVLLIANGTSVSMEMDLMSWAMLEIAHQPHLDRSMLEDSDPAWRDEEQVSVVPDELAMEDVMRIWDRFGAVFTLTMPYVLRTVQLQLRREETRARDVETRVFPSGVL